MKKILYTLVVAVLALTSCNEDILDPKPTTKIDASVAFSSPKTLQAFRAGLYGQGNYYAANEVPLISGQIALLSDILGNDMVYGYTWYQAWNSAYSYKVGKTSNEPENLWMKMYFLQEACNTLVNADIKNIDASIVKQYKAEAKAIRAWVYFEVAHFFGKAYSLDNGASKAFPYLTTADYNALPERNTVAKIYEMAIADLEAALPDLSDKKSVGAYYMNKSAANAILARIYADMATTDSYKKARDYAREAIKGIGFMTTAEYKKGLSNGGTNSEAILAFYTDPNQYNKWRSFNSFHDSWDGMGDDFLCNSSLVEQFANNDIRRGFFLDERYYYKYYDGNVYGGKSYPVSVLITTAEQAKGYYTYGKFPRRDVVIGSSRGTLGVGDYIAIRATEMKLLIAECDARIGDNNDEAQTILFDIQKRSIPTAVKTTETGKALLDLIKLETRKELFGEGHSLRLIKRWGEGLKRDGSHVAMVDLSPEAPEFVWPTPERETTVNKNLLK